MLLLNLSPTSAIAVCRCDGEMNLRSYISCHDVILKVQCIRHHFLDLLLIASVHALDNWTNASEKSPVAVLTNYGCVHQLHHQVVAMHHLSYRAHARWDSEFNVITFYAEWTHLHSMQSIGHTEVARSNELRLQSLLIQSVQDACILADIVTNGLSANRTSVHGVSERDVTATATTIAWRELVIDDVAILVAELMEFVAQFSAVYQRHFVGHCLDSAGAVALESAEERMGFHRATTELILLDLESDCEARCEFI